MVMHAASGDATSCCYGGLINLQAFCAFCIVAGTLPKRITIKSFSLDPHNLVQLGG